MNFSPKILGMSVEIFGTVFLNLGSCLMNCFGPGANVFRFCYEFGVGTIVKQFGTETRTTNGLCVLC